MKILHLSTSDTVGGASRAAFRLHKGLQGIGTDSRMLVNVKAYDDPSILGPESKWKKGFPLVQKAIDAIPLEFYRNKRDFIFSPAISPDSLASKVAILNPDLIHLHWICAGFMRIETIKRFRKPIIWTIHDSWPFTGGCHIPFDCKRYTDSCGSCPMLGSSRKWDLSYWIWMRKHRSWHNLNLTVIAPSNWLASCARASSLFCKSRIEVIRNGLDTRRFRSINKHDARELLLLPKDKKLILFGAARIKSDKNKGLHLLLSALNKLSQMGWNDKAELLIFGASHPAEFLGSGIKANYLGHLNDEISLSLLYAAADVFVISSIQENLPNTIMEAFASGTPVAGFNTGGIPEMIEHQKNGYLAKAMDSDDLANGIGWLLADSQRYERLSLAAREKAVQEYSIETQAKRYQYLYEELYERDKKTFHRT